jgi:hypothetical protein
MEIQHFSNCFTFQSVKLKYKELALIHHPEKGGDYEIMREINLEYKNIYENLLFGLNLEPAQVRQEFFIFPIIISRVIALEGVHLEMFSNCLWLSGTTTQHSKYLEDLGFLFSENKSQWYFPSIKNMSAPSKTQIELPF